MKTKIKIEAFCDTDGSRCGECPYLSLDGWQEPFCLAFQTRIIGRARCERCLKAEIVLP